MLVRAVYCRLQSKFSCRYRFRPRVLKDVSKVNLSVQLQGEWVESPVGVAPTAMQRMAHDQGEIATAQGPERLICYISFKQHSLSAWQDFSNCYST